jgi:hypothetical protein
VEEITILRSKEEMDGEFIDTVSATNTKKWEDAENEKRKSQ